MGVMKCVSVGVVGEAARAAEGREAIGRPGGGVVILDWFQMFGGLFAVHVTLPVHV